jgi:hypothetical protein
LAFDECVPTPIPPDAISVEAPVLSGVTCTLTGGAATGGVKPAEPVTLCCGR